MVTGNCLACLAELRAVNSLLFDGCSRRGCRLVHVTSLRRFASYYTRSSLPFLSGLSYGVFLVSWDHPLWLQVLAGLALVVLGPFAIQLVLTLFVEALRGVPDEPRTVASAPPRASERRGLEPGGLFGRLTRDR